MNADVLIDSLARFPGILRAVVGALDDATLRRRGGAQGQAWSIVEILCHLADEEMEDFRARLELTLRDPCADWPKIDPEGAARTRRYQEQDPHEALERFLAARQANLKWLASLGVVNWSLAAQHPRLGALRAGDLLASWAAHDLLHLRQIAKRLYEAVGVAAGGFDTGYAGAWTA